MVTSRAKHTVWMWAATVLATVLVLVPAVPALGADAVFVFNDPVGDTASAPDVGRVAVEWTAGGPLVLDVTLANVDGAFPEESRVEVALDVELDNRTDLLLQAGASPFEEPRVCRRISAGGFQCNTSPDLEATLTGNQLRLVLSEDPILSGPPIIDQFQLRVTGIDGYPSVRSADFAGPWAVYVVDTEPPEIIVLVDPLIVWAQGPDGTAVNYFTFVRASDLVDPNPSISCDPPSGSVLPIGENPVTCVATDASDNTASRTFVVHVLGAEEILAFVVADIESSGAQAGAGLAAILETSIANLDSGRDGPACRTLDAFLRVGGHLAEMDESGIQEWWISTVEYVAQTNVECTVD